MRGDQAFVSFEPASAMWSDVVSMLNGETPRGQPMFDVVFEQPKPSVITRSVLATHKLDVIRDTEEFRARKRKVIDYLKTNKEATLKELNGVIGMQRTATQRVVWKMADDGEIHVVRRLTGGHFTDYFSLEDPCQSKT